ncbi:hypothetical protein CSA37_03370 [Candidatus Fermentibacteria bacterium]|nr:MAG: hypothetical protein CSA37_03370 [Candidatus Fermentibacteria bacterium]
MNKNKQFSGTQPAAALMFVLLIHNMVRWLPGSFRFGTSATLFAVTASALLLLGIILVLLKKKAGLLLGLLNGVLMVFMPIFIHIIKGLPDINGIWWYPILPWSISILTIHFCVQAWKK